MNFLFNHLEIMYTDQDTHVFSSERGNKRLQCYDRSKKNSFDQPVKHDLITYDNIRKTASDQGDNCTTGCLLDYPYLKKTIR